MRGPQSRKGKIRRNPTAPAPSSRALHWAAEGNRPDMVAALVTAGAETECRLVEDPKTPLHLAAEKGAADGEGACSTLPACMPLLPNRLLIAAAVEVLLEAGASHEARTAVGATPLFLAAAGGHLAAAELLLMAGAAVDAKQSQQAAPVHVAASRGHSGVLELLLRYRASVDMQ